MDQNDLLVYVTKALERHQIRYGITGSHASNIYGETRFTNDIDIVVNITSRDHLEQLLADFPARLFYVSDVSARHAVARGGQFNVIHEDSLQKIDLQYISQWAKTLGLTDIWLAIQKQVGI